uniref:T9SS type A sorting domain-containing protein n=1 Tax=Flavobacterium sp. TaxID=239 RepID=UPI003752A7FE
STWYYSGKNILKFNTGIPRTNGTINFPGVGNSLGSDGLDNSFQNISIQNDDNGNVLFFTDGKDVFNGSNPAVKINSTMLFGGGETSQNTIILKSALNSNQYYIINNLTNTIFFPQSHAGIRYSIVNVNNGIASMSNTINIPIVPSTTQTGFITSTLDSAFSTSKSVQAVEKSDGGFWIITSLVKSDGKTYLGIFDFSTNGTIVLKNTFLLPSLFWLSAGNSYLTSGNIADLSISPNGNKIIYTYQAKGSIILDFDKYEGVLSQTTTFEYNDSLYTSFAFSPDSKLIYTRLGQMDLDAPVVRKNPFSETLNPRLSYAYGPDGKIYYLSFNNSTIKLGVIHKHNTKALIANPNSFINQEDFLKPEFDFSGNNYLPNFVHSKKVTAYDVNKISAYKTGCNSYKFFPDVPTNSIISAFSWNFGDTNSGVSNNTSTLNTPTHAFSASGTYTVTLTYNGNTTITTQVTITTFTPPAIQGTESRCVISGSATSFNSVALQDGQTVVWSILSGTGTILTNNQSEVQITWTQLPGTVKAIITDSSGCSGTVTKTITVLPNVTPTFNAIPAICSGNSLVLPTTSLNGITGVWRPAANNTETTTYTFNPNTVQCATTATLTVTVLPANDPSCTTAPCLPNLTLSVPETNSSIIYKRTNWIVANTNYNVGVNKTVTMKAGDYILLSSNIHILSGSNFSARIEACTAQSKSSNPQGKIVELKDAIIENEISVYPNPTRDLITISCGNQKMNNVTIFSVDGKTVFYKFNLKENILTLNTSSFKNGIYILTIETAAGQITRRKIIKE